MKQSLAIGDPVTYPGSPGVGSVSELAGGEARVDFFASVAVPVVESNWVPANSCRPAPLDPTTRVYWRNPDNGKWRPGRVSSRIDNRYYVTFPNYTYDFPIPSDQLRTRWDGEHTDPAAVLGVGAHESGYFRNTRLPFLRELVALRGASANTSGFLSSAVEIYSHQVDSALTVLSDPVQRYLLADEVGLGKTVQAGYVIRQTLIDTPSARIIVLTPDKLRRQWAEELVSKFFIDEFRDAQIKFRSHESPETWSSHRVWDLLVVDEAHRLTQVESPSESAYPELRALAHSINKVLLLSATPTTSYFKTHLGMLHLLDPKLYPWEDASRFEERYKRRAELADCIYSLDPQFSMYLATSIGDIRELIGAEDTQFELLSQAVLNLLDENDEPRPEVTDSELSTRVEELRAHISETYRLHRRVIRNRRATVLQESPDAEFPSYEVRGRKAPSVLGLDSLAHDHAETGVLNWYYKAVDEHSEPTAEQAAGLGAAIKVLATRSGVIVDDLVDALRWRVRSDSAAANRAQLSEHERRALTTAPVMAFEAGLLSDLETNHLSTQDKFSALHSLTSALVSELKKYQRSVIFCGPGQLASLLVQHFRAKFPNVRVGEHTNTVDQQASHDAVREWAKPGQGRRILIMDGTGEDGLNLQVAEAAFHLRFPWSPNQLEQRMGRLDRYRSVDAIGQSMPAAQYRVSSTEGDETLNDAWTELLVSGYGLFDDSVSTLQDAIAEATESVWAQAATTGPAGIRAKTAFVRSKLVDAREAIEKMDMLESIHHTVSRTRSIAPELNRFEERWKGWQEALLAFASESEGGIHLKRKPSESDRVVHFDIARSRPLVDPRQWMRTVTKVAPPAAKAAFNRSYSLRSVGTRLFRPGNPLTDALANWAWNDDRGQATAFSRPYVHQVGGAEPYFGFDYLIEADTKEAISLVSEQVEAERALRRQADRILVPFTVRVWMPALSETPVTHPAQKQWLDQPYDKVRLHDRNYSDKRVDELFALFGGADKFQSATARAEAASREHMRAVTDLQRLCDEAREVAEQRLAIARAQARARSAAGHLVGDAQSYLLDTDVTNALISGLSSPSARLVAAICLVRVPGTTRVR
ncbi:DEAD/DEAH box helicase [Actinokineospora sp. PR83]|uniref:protein DpdE n=1 Tax=Actinokineospora sp. PR83 TaxID=2884908 RepID=UPI001F2B2409|nr:protein DpdE [Actinokineospora sp. PR83]MCG8917383.1 DEAD/DEAH box helicase [Actinokineospora sp. PR83]